MCVGVGEADTGQQGKDREQANSHLVWADHTHRVNMNES